MTRYTPYTKGTAEARATQQTRPSRAELAKREQGKQQRAAEQDRLRAAYEARVTAGVATHHADVPGKGGGHGGNPNHDEQGRFA